MRGTRLRILRCPRRRRWPRADGASGFEWIPSATFQQHMPRAGSAHPVSASRFRLAALEELHRLLVFPGRGQGLEGAQIAAAARLRILLARIESVFARLEFANHVAVASPCASSRIVCRLAQPCVSLRMVL